MMYGRIFGEGLVREWKWVMEYPWKRIRVCCSTNLCPFDISPPAHIRCSFNATIVARIAQAVLVLPVPGGP